MKVQHRTEMTISIIGGLLLLLHGIHGSIEAIAYFRAPAVHAVSVAGSSFASGEAAGYAAGAAIDHVFWPLSSLFFGGALLWLAARKRLQHGSAAQAA